jgi:thiamine biosynthesis lipoprotein
MGTTYHIAYIDSSESKLKKSIDSLLIEINQAVSTYIPDSQISQLNQDSLGKEIEVLSNSSYVKNIAYQLPYNEHFVSNYLASKDIFKKTQGYFDPTVMPLVNYWGFGYTPKKGVTQADTNFINKISQSVSFDLWTEDIGTEHVQLIKPQNAQLDFSAIAKGYAVDEVAELIENRGINNYIVEIGGEVFAKGQKQNGQKWTTALSRPQVKAAVTDVQLAIRLDNIGLASSGNYRNFHKVNGKIYGHEINPLTGFPEINELLGVSVLAPTCIMADAYATAFMILGLEKSLKLVDEIPELEAIFFYSNDASEIDFTKSVGFDKLAQPL